MNEPENIPTPRTDTEWHDAQHLSYQQRFDVQLALSEQLERELATVTAERDAERSSHSDFLAYISGELSAYECKCGKHSAESTPPMMWPELIACIIAKQVEVVTAERDAHKQAALKLEAKLAEAMKDTDRLDVIEDECFDLRAVNCATGGDDYEVYWRVVSHHMAQPKEREEGLGQTPRAAIDAAIAQEGAK